MYGPSLLEEGVPGRETLFVIQVMLDLYNVLQNSAVAHDLEVGRMFHFGIPSSQSPREPEAFRLMRLFPLCEQWIASSWTIFAFVFFQTTGAGWEQPQPSLWGRRVCR